MIAPYIVGVIVGIIVGTVLTGLHFLNKVAHLDITIAKLKDANRYNKETFKQLCTSHADLHKKLRKKAK